MEQKKITSEFIQSIRQIMIGRQTVPFRYDAREIEHIDLTTLDKTSQGTSVTALYNKSYIGALPVYWKDVTIPEDTRIPAADLIANEAARIEDYLIFQGEKKDGLLYQAGNLSIHPLDFLTCGNATKAICVATDLLIRDGYDERRGLNLLLHKIQFTELTFSSCATGVSELSQARKILHGGSTYQAEMPEGTGLMIPTVSSNMDMFYVTLYMDWQVIKLSQDELTYRICVSFDLTVPTPFMICRIENI